MEPCCQTCGAENPEWFLRSRGADKNGPEICADCVRNAGADFPIRILTAVGFWLGADPDDAAGFVETAFNNHLDEEWSDETAHAIVDDFMTELRKSRGQGISTPLPSDA